MARTPVAAVAWPKCSSPALRTLAFFRIYLSTCFYLAAIFARSFLSCSAASTTCLFLLVKGMSPNICSTRVRSARSADALRAASFSLRAAIPPLLAANVRRGSSAASTLRLRVAVPRTPAARAHGQLCFEAPQLALLSFSLLDHFTSTR